MSDSERLAGDSVVVRDQGSLIGGVDLPVPPDACCQRHKPLSDACQDAGSGAGAVLFERELALKGIDDALDPLPDRSERAVAVLLTLAVWAEQPGAQLSHTGLQKAVGEAFVADDDLPFLDRA